MTQRIINSLPKGTVLKGKSYNYVIEKALGQGTFGITYLAKVKMQMQGELGSIDSNVNVAIKEFFMKDINGREDSLVTSGSNGGIFTDYRKKFAREAENLSKLNHPNIIRVLESFESNNTIYYAMEYIDGGSLDDYIAHCGSIDEKETAELIAQIGDALSFMHDNKMLHLDLKPANIMRRSKGELVLIDFGLSKQYDGTGEPESSTTVGRGTPGYAPLEQANYQDGHGFPVTMDVYALGATMFKMLTGERAPEASVILNEGFDALVDKMKNVSSETKNIVCKSMSPTKKKRFQSVKEMLSAISNVRIYTGSSGSGICGSVEPEVTIVDPGSGGNSKPTPATKPKPQPAPKPKPARQLGWKWIISGVAAAAIIISVAILQSGRNEPSIINYNDSIATNQTKAEDSPQQSISGTINGHDYVDLGLSVKWATKNVGASSPSDYGDYFAWGETSKKDEYDISNSKTWDKSLGDISGNVQYDAARANWGGTWRLPTKNECQELVDRCTWSWTSQGGHDGYRVTSKTNGNSIFLPAAGFRDGMSHDYGGEFGYSWSSTPHESSTQSAYSLSFDSSNPNVDWGYRFYGRSVRPVSE